ncbi:MAG: DUF885 domain-containing protein [Bacteroidota bacterium]|nr:DUF885 domain-containing protein [Bacteroidota bacterium]MDP4212504.1 DUF885 domain-containing protein [Bacteroidota bacterium]MDP4248913.1 DUF885 domain-containing protein [Bacteroidota bacterium]
MNTQHSMQDNKQLSIVFNNYYEDRCRIIPIEATQNGNNRYNDVLPIEFTDDYLDTLRLFYSNYLNRIRQFNRDMLSENDQISYDIFEREMEISLEGVDLRFSVNTVIMPNLQYMPFNQFEGIPLLLGQMGSGTGIQPFKTVTDYDHWIRRASAFAAWTDSAIVYFRKGIANGYLLPRCLVIKMIPQMEAMVTSDVTKSLFYGPANLIPASFSAPDKARVTGDLVKLIRDILSPAYKRLADFLQNEYLPKSRSSIGFDDLPNGNTLYNYLIRYWTTTNKTPEEIYQTGLSEVKRIRGEMELTKAKTGFPDNLDSFFTYMRTNPRFMPFKTPDEVLGAFRKIQRTIDPNLKNLFGHTPKMDFEIRQTEAFRAASASAEYYPGDPHGSRPGIFYVPIPDATKFNTTSGMESLFLHEAIPGHHYQISLQMEDTLLPDFRRFAWYGAYGEGWALYCESLGRELGLYTDPYQYMGALRDEIERAIRLVVDVAMHQKKMTREQAIKYMTDNEAITEEDATAAIERYIAIPAQALSYKTGAMKIRELRNRYAYEMGPYFNLSAFHDEVLKDGCMPLDIFERKMDAWEMHQ